MADRNADELREGLTTGTYAAATARAGALSLVQNRSIETVRITLPIGRTVRIPVENGHGGSAGARFAAVKDAGDDPDVTDGARIYSTVTPADEPGIHILGGEGVGHATLPGMPVEVGEPAVNPVPRSMIEQAVSDILESSDLEGLDVEVAVEDGEELAKRTLNPRLGIEGGLSILGTTGVVKPYSHASFIATIEQGIDVAKANGYDRAVFSTGGRTEQAAQARHPELPDLAFVQFGGFFYETLEALSERRLDRADVYFMPGKFSKLAQGHLKLHSDNSRVDPDRLRADVLERFRFSESDREDLRSLQSTNQVLDRLNMDQVRRLMADWLERAAETIVSEFEDRLLLDRLHLHVVSLEKQSLGSKEVPLP